MSKRPLTDADRPAIEAAIEAEVAKADPERDMLIIGELKKRMPGATEHDLKQAFVAVMVEYGEEALYALTSGHVKIAPRKPGDKRDHDGE